MKYMDIAPAGTFPVYTPSPGSRIIEITDYWFNMKTVTWKGRSHRVEYDLFTQAVQTEMAKGRSKESVLDDMFETLDQIEEYA